MVSFFGYLRLFCLMCVRNTRWVWILLFRGGERPWPVLDFQMNLNASQPGLDPKENSIHKQLILDGIREQHATAIMQQYIRPDDVILELGANIGYYVCLESRILSSEGFIYAVEPAPENVALLKRNVALNQISVIEVTHMAMSDKPGTARLYTGKACNLHSLVNESGEDDTHSMEVPTDTVDGFLANRRPISFLRMDIEGYEAVVIDGMRDTLSSPTLRRMFIEIHPALIEVDSMQRFLEKLQEAGFEATHVISRDNWQRAVLGQAKVEQLTLSQLMQDERILHRRNAFEIFFEKQGESR